MGLVYSIIYLLLLSAAALGLVWLLFYKLPSNEAKTELSVLDKDLVKVHDHILVHKHRKYIFAVALFAVSVFVFKLITYKEIIEHKIVKAKKPVSEIVGEELDIPPVDIPEPEPPKPQVVFTPKVVENNIEVKPKVDSLPKALDLFDDDDDDDDPPEEKKKEVVKVILTDNPGVLPEYVNGGEVGLDNAMTLALQDALGNYDAGFYPIPLQFIVETNGRVSNVKIEPGSEGEVVDMGMANLVMKQFQKIAVFTPGSKDGQVVRVRMSKPFFFDIE